VINSALHPSPQMLPSGVIALEERCKEYALPEGASFDYGTAGFRTHASRLLPVAFRVGALAAARSAACNGAVTGVMVTVRSPLCLFSVSPCQRSRSKRTDFEVVGESQPGGR
jgi:hypothetical protein